MITNIVVVLPGQLGADAEAAEPCQPEIHRRTRFDRPRLAFDASAASSATLRYATGTATPAVLRAQGL